jgi:hypothetical protein
LSELARLEAPLRARIAAAVEESTPPDMATAMVRFEGMKKLPTSILASLRFLVDLEGNT